LIMLAFLESLVSLDAYHHHHWIKWSHLLFCSLPCRLSSFFEKRRHDVLETSPSNRADFGTTAKRMWRGISTRH